MRANIDLKFKLRAETFEDGRDPLDGAPNLTNHVVITTSFGLVQVYASSDGLIILKDDKVLFEV